MPEIHQEPGVLLASHIPPLPAPPPPEEMENTDDDTLIDLQESDVNLDPIPDYIDVFDGVNIFLLQVSTVDGDDANPAKSDTDTYWYGYW